jgi:hypothetical protein
MKITAFLLLTLLTASAQAGNPALSQTSAVPAGERVANYLQALMTSAGEMVTAKSAGDIFSPKDTFHLSFNYDPEAQVIDVYLTGKLEKAEDIKPIFDLTQKLILRLSDKIQKYYGVTLKAEALSMDYLNLNSGKVILKLVNGQYMDRTTPETVAAPAVMATHAKP